MAGQQQVAGKTGQVGMEIDYLNELIDNLLSELVVKKQKVEELQAQLKELEDEGQGDNEE